MNEQAIRFQIGVFVLAALIVLAVLITLFGGFPTYFKKTDDYTIIFDNAPGVSPGTPIKRSGVTIGEVRAVRLDNDTGLVYVDITIENGYYLRPGDRPTLDRNVLGGDTSIVFQPPPPEEKKPPERVQPGATLKGYTPPDPTAILQKATELVVPAQEALLEIRKVFKSIDKIMPGLDEAVKAFGDLAKSGKEIAPELNRTAKEVQDLARTTREAVPEFQKTAEEIRLLSRSTRDILPELRRTTEEFGATARLWGRVGERTDVLLQTNEQKITKSIEGLQDALKRTNEALNDENLRNLRDIMRNVRVGSERIDSITRNTDETLKDTRVTLKQLTDSLRRLDDILLEIQKTTGPIGKSGPVILQNLEEGTVKLNRAMTDVRELLQVFGKNDGTVQRLMTDPALYNNLNDAAGMVTRIVPRLDRILRDVEIFADRIARHPESLGIGGAIRPSSGLKEAPSQIRAPGH